MGDVESNVDDTSDAVVGAWSELKLTEKIGEDTAKLLYDIVDAVRRFGHFPPPDGSGRWDEGAVHEVAHEFLVGKDDEDRVRAAARLRRLVATATDEGSFELLLQEAVRNHFRMEARRTNVGAVIRSLEHAVKSDPEIVTVGSRSSTKAWALRRYAEQLPYSGNPDVLIDAAHAMPEVRRARWSATSRRRAPIAEPAYLLRVIRAILKAAKAPVLRRLFVDVIVARFPLAVDPPSVELDESLTDHAASPEATAVAAVVWEELNDNGRLVVGVLDLDARKIAAVTGLSKSTADRAKRSAKTVLAEHLDDADDQAGVVAALAAASKALQRRGTDAAGSASLRTEED